MTLNFSLLDVRAGLLVRDAFLRLSSLVSAVFSKPRGAVSVVLPHPCPLPLPKEMVQRRYRLEVTLLGRTAGEHLLRQVSSMLSADGMVIHSARLNLRENDMGRLTVETSCTCEHRAKLVQFVEYASGTPGVTRVRWETIPGSV